MWKLMKFLIGIVMLGMIVLLGLTVPLGRYTLFEHLGRIWRAEETQELIHGTKSTAEPAVDKLKRGVQKGYEAATEPEPKSNAEGVRKKKRERTGD